MCDYTKAQLASVDFNGPFNASAKFTSNGIETRNITLNQDSALDVVNGLIKAFDLQGEMLLPVLEKLEDMREYYKELPKAEHGSTEHIIRMAQAVVNTDVFETRNEWTKKLSEKS